MPNYSRHVERVALFLLAVDFLCISLSAIVSAYVHPNVDTWAESWYMFLSHITSFLVVFGVWFIVGWSQRMFVSHRRSSLTVQTYQTLRAVMFTLLISYFLVDLLGYYVLVGALVDEITENRYVITFGLLTLCTITGLRLLLAFILASLRSHGFNVKQVLVVGANDRTAGLLEIITARSQFGYHVVGVIDDDPGRMKLLARYKVPYLGSFSEAERVLTESVIDEVHVGLPVRSCYEQIQSLADLCLGVGVAMRLVADLFPLQLATSRVHDFEGVPMLSLTTASEDPYQLFLKRIADVVLSGLMLLLLSPLLFAAAAAIKLSSPGPVFFLQERVGLNQRKFKMIKFRSMVEDAEAQLGALAGMNEADGPIFKIKDDPRVTVVGRLIRKYSIDELPQLINVLMGEMSLVGPRPHPTPEVEKYTWHQRRRLSVKPGLTGLAQVSGRSDLAWQECVDLDLGYIDTWSVAKDLAILFRTFHAVATARGAS